MQQHLQKIFRHATIKKVFSRELSTKRAKSFGRRERQAVRWGERVPSKQGDAWKEEQEEEEEQYSHSKGHGKGHGDGNGNKGTQFVSEDLQHSHREG